VSLKYGRRNAARKEDAEEFHVFAFIVLPNTSDGRLMEIEESP